MFLNVKLYFYLLDGWNVKSNVIVNKIFENVFKMK